MLLVIAIGLGLVALTLSLLVPASIRPGQRLDAARPVGHEPNIRVRVQRGVAVVSITGSGKAFVGLDTSKAPTRMIELPANARNQAGRIVLTDAADRIVSFEPADLVRLTLASGEPVELDRVPVGDALILRPRTDDDRLDAIAQLPLESYLAGVVARELYAGWPEETFKAQAVAARSYALHERAHARQRSRSWDIEAGTRNQGFGGLTSQRAAHRAVAATRGLVLTDRGSLMRAYYSGVCGGRPASARDVWTPSDTANTARPLDASSHEPWCEHAPLYRWSTVRYEPALRDRLRAWGRARRHDLRRIGALASIEAIETNAVGRPVRYRVTDTDGLWAELSAEQLRIACNTRAPNLPPPAARARVHSGDLLVSIRGDRVEITGRGAGHGVGLCQYGAAAMGRAGHDWRTMLDLYYPDSEVKPWYD